MQDRGQREVTEASMWGKSGKRVGESGVGQTAGEAGEAGEAGHSWQVWDELGQGTVLGRPGPGPGGRASRAGPRARCRAGRPRQAVAGPRRAESPRGVFQGEIY